jgi:arsenite methyltransferase
MTQTLDAEVVKQAVRKAYGDIATGSITSGCCSPAPAGMSGTSGSGCCGGGGTAASRIGYSADEEAAAPEGANLGLGCGNPQTIASLKVGERVLDLGSGAGFDAFLAAQQVGPDGRVIGVDMTPEMVTRARANITKTPLKNVEFRLGEIERLPIADASVDVIISNCVINLSTDKPSVFREAFRVLAPGGRLAISDIVAIREVPAELKADLQAYSGCVSGAAVVTDTERMLREAGFTDVRIDLRGDSRSLVEGWAPGQRAEDYVASAQIQAVKRL